MNIFLIDQGTVFTYSDLLNDINRAKAYYPQYQTGNLYNYFLNLIVALASNQQLLLIDSDINSLEFDGVDVRSINTASPIKEINASSIAEILIFVQRSTSEISIYTSGTTGQPKKVIHTIKTLTRTVRIYEHFSEKTWGFAYNPTHMAGLQVFLQALLNINTLVNIFNKPRDVVYEAIDKYAITHISATPTFYRLLLPVEKSFDSVKYATLGGEKSDKKLHDTIIRIFPNARINNIYATTEAGSLFSAKGEYFHIPQNIFDKIKIEEDELLIHKSLLGESDSFTFSGDYYRSGDIIEWVNELEGLFRFKSRKNELINIGGYKVNPSEVESQILQIPEVLQVVVYGKANSVMGNILCAEVRIENLSSISELDIRKYLSEILQDFKIPRKIKFVDSFSTTRTGKLKRL